jgi:hypothetical protein
MTAPQSRKWQRLRGETIHEIGGTPTPQSISDSPIDVDTNYLISEAAPATEQNRPVNR